MIYVTSKTTDKDLGLKTLIDELEDLDGTYVDVGLFGGEKHPGDSELTTAQIGAVHEFGSSIRHGRSGGQTVIVPERSWLRRNHDQHAAKYKDQLDEIYSTVLSTQSKALMQLMLRAFAERVASDVRRTITEVREPPLAPATIKKKGGKSNPLIDTGAMRQSVRGRVSIGSFRVS